MPASLMGPGAISGGVPTQDLHDNALSLRARPNQTSSTHRLLGKCLLPMRHVNATTASVHERVHAPCRISDSSFPPTDRIRPTSLPCRISQSYRISRPVLKLKWTWFFAYHRLIQFIILSLSLLETRRLAKSITVSVFISRTLLNNFYISYIPKTLLKSIQQHRAFIQENKLT